MWLSVAAVTNKPAFLVGSCPVRQKPHSLSLVGALPRVSQAQIEVSPELLPLSPAAWI